MSSTEIEIPDEPQRPGGSGGPGTPGAPGPSGEPGGEEPESPYRNLLVPLVVVPALIVMVLVLVGVLFGTIAGSEATPQENLARLLSGGANERTQASFNLVRQVLEDLEARQKGEPEEWDLDATFLPQLRAAYAGCDELKSEEDVLTPLCLAMLMTRLGDPEGVGHLVELTRLDEALDPGAEYRFRALSVLGGVADGLEPAVRQRAARVLIEHLEGDDPGLSTVSASALGSYPGEETLAALRGALGAADLQVRGTAALSLARLEDPACVGVLEELLTPAAYASERSASAQRWTRPELVSESRRKALAALVELGQGPDRAELTRLSEEDDDLLLRDLARKLLRDG